MRNALAFLRQDFLAEASYRLKMLLSVFGVAFSVIPIFYIARGLQPVMEEAIRGEGSDYFMFVVLGIAAHRVIDRVVHGLPSAIHVGVRTGTLEALFATPARLGSMIAGLSGYRLAWGALEAVVLLTVGVLLGGRLAAGGTFVGAGIFLLIVLAHVPFGLFAGALQLAFRTSAQLPRLVVIASLLFGGVYYPTRVIPDFVESLSGAVPLTYGLRALRATVLEGADVTAVSADLLSLLVLTIALTALGTLAFTRALAYSRRLGTLAQY